MTVAVVAKPDRAPPIATGRGRCYGHLWGDGLQVVNWCRTRSTDRRSARARSVGKMSCGVFGDRVEPVPAGSQTALTMTGVCEAAFMPFVAFDMISLTRAVSQPPPPCASRLADTGSIVSGEASACPISVGRRQR